MFIPDGLVYHTKLHTSQTIQVMLNIIAKLVYHTKLHTSQTYTSGKWWHYSLVYHTKLHTSQTAGIVSAGE